MNVNFLSKLSKFTWAMVVLFQADQFSRCFLFGPTGVSSTDAFHPLCLRSGRQCHASTDSKPRLLVQLPLMPGPRYLV